jgi:hypothetical protein
MQKIDLVYVLGSGSVWNNNELRFSLRSVEKNLKGVGNIYVIGENPGFFTDNIIHIYHPDPLDQNADGNMALKIIRACRETELTDDFLFMNDDFIINRSMTAVEIPWMHKGDMKDHPEKFWKTQFYRYRLRRTFDILAKSGYPTIQYDYHAPMRMNKILFPQIMEQFNFKDDIGYTFRSLYGNCLGLPAEKLKDQKKTIYRYYNIQQIKQLLENARFVGFNDKGLNFSLKWWLISNFPVKSKYEKNNPSDIILDLYSWSITGREYNKGVQIFENYYRHKHLLHLFKSGETRILRKKLDFKLSQLIKEL